MTEEEKGGARSSSLEELGQKVDALDGYIRDYRNAKRSNKTVKIVVVVAIVAVVLFYVALFANDMYKVYGNINRLRGDPAYRQEMAQAFQDGLIVMRPQVVRELRKSFERVRPKLVEELKTTAEEFRPEIEEAVRRESKALYDRVFTQLEAEMHSAATDVVDHITDEELPALYDNIHAEVLKELKKTVSRLTPVLEERVKEQANILYESLTAELSAELHKEFDSLLRDYMDMLEEKFPEITDKDKLAQMAANLTVAFEEATREIINERFSEHMEALLDIAETMEGFKVPEGTTDEELWREVKDNLLELLQIKLATEMVKTKD